MVDLWNTVIYSYERDEHWRSIKNEIGRKDIIKENFFTDLKEEYFKKDQSPEQVVRNMTYKHGDNPVIEESLLGIMKADNTRLMNGRAEMLYDLNKKGYRVYAVSDCGRDTREFLEQSGLQKHFKNEFLSFENGTTKDEKLYGIVKETLGSDATMIGDGLIADYKMPLKHGFKAKLLRPGEELRL